jgi:hypothetical protein
MVLWHKHWRFYAEPAQSIEPFVSLKDIDDMTKTMNSEIVLKYTK